jgi:ABC-type nickel/cobalt efflux system permease component RcnA
MFGLDDYLASLTDGTSLVLVAVVAALLGLRHATDPDHLAAVTTLVAGTRDRAARRAAGLGAAWGAGHALTLFFFGLPIVLFSAYLPAELQQAAEAAVGVLIIVLALWLLLRWRRGFFHAHEHRHGDAMHVHAHPLTTAHDHEPARTPLGAFGVGLLHGVGGSAGVGILIVATIESTGYAVAALAVLAAFTAISMTGLTAAFGLTLSSRRVTRSYDRVAPALGVASLAFGVWYAAAALELAPYYF